MKNTETSVELLKNLFRNHSFTLDDTELLNSCSFGGRNTVDIIHTIGDEEYVYFLDLENTEVVNSSTINVWDIESQSFVKVTFYSIKLESPFTE